MNATASVVQGQETAFPKAEYDARVAKARQGLAEAGLDVMIVTGPENIFYLTGQQTPGYYTFQALVLPVEGEPFFVVRQLEYFNFVANTFITDASIYQDTDDPIRFLVALIESRGLKGKRVAIDKRGWFLPIATYEALQTALGTVHDAAGVVEKLRMVKSPLEVEKLARSAAYVDEGLKAGLAAVRVGNTENDIVAAMMGAAIATGSEYMGMEPLVSSGPRCGVPHGTWKRRRLEAGDPAFLEMAASHDRYHAALMRSAWLGTPPAEALDMMKVCQEVLAAALDSIKPGVACEVPHIVGQKIIDAAGYTDNFRKRLGYSVGISFAPDWGEGGILSLNAGVKTPLAPGMTFHLPPALRIYGQFTVGVSETIVVTETGCRVLGTLDRALVQIPA
ncbi:M24 family metallopeptidase [Ancylobacter pratisalsi]|uniref:Aminopeptidase P family protein n=1 Tax=Ancylobacter pratisalsi TaxID=1745854 RepID=A0A6P1YMX3_9HYPH|nr:Xaa-Pro peptidase family protein [Ancylobacter pratisalsi]QIB33583.1 aminopeptidase P family protein [Ancylobacter pratisalsi]